ncbi:MAG: hypothetical protein PHD67_01430 [Oscillospiraceae bacterium]|nr:hypothetical protein [Oscillospiraceae bacterium]
MTGYEEKKKSAREYEAYENYLAEEAAAEKRAKRKAVGQAVKQLKRQIPEIEQEAEDAIRQANVNKMLTLRDLPQQLAASGSSGGMTDSAVLGVNTAYEKSWNELIRDRDKAIRAIQDNIAKMRADGDLSLEDIEDQYRRQLAKKALELGLYDRPAAQGQGLSKR